MKFKNRAGVLTQVDTLVLPMLILTSLTSKNGCRKLNEEFEVLNAEANVFEERIAENVSDILLYKEER